MSNNCPAGPGSFTVELCTFDSSIMDQTITGNGSATATVTGGSGSFTYYWLVWGNCPNNICTFTTPSISGLSQTWLTLMVTDTVTGQQVHVGHNTLQTAVYANSSPTACNPCCTSYTSPFSN